ncbi:MAG: ABC transporter ATP-binding protein, partial [Streptosporangiaceae bacterium]
MNSPLISARGVVKSFGRTPALRGADVQVAAGEILAVMGPSGLGKSTLLHCLAGIFPPDEGEISFDGRRLDQMDETRRTELRRSAFGFVFQFGQLVPELTAADNVALPLLLGRVRRKAAYQIAAQWLTRLGLEGKDGRRSGELSGGEAQRVAVARALAIGPRVLPVLLGVHAGHLGTEDARHRGARGAGRAERAVELQRGLLRGPDHRAARRGRAGSG